MNESTTPPGWTSGVQATLAWLLATSLIVGAAAFAMVSVERPVLTVSASLVLSLAAVFALIAIRRRSVGVPRIAATLLLLPVVGLGLLGVVFLFSGNGWTE